MSNNFIEVCDEKTNNIPSLYHPTINCYITKGMHDKILELNPSFDVLDALEKSSNKIHIKYFGLYPVTNNFYKIGECGYGKIVKTNSNSKFKINDDVYFSKDKFLVVFEYPDGAKKQQIVRVEHNYCFDNMDDYIKSLEEKHFEMAQDATAEIKAKITEELETEPVEINKDENDLSFVIKTVLDLYKLNKTMLKFRLRSAIIDIKVMEKIRSESKSNEEFEALKSCLNFFLELGTKKTPYDKCIEISSTHYKVSPSSLKSIVAVRNNAIKTANKLQ
jgi:hypothetical protein